MEQEHVHETSVLYMAEGIRAISENTSGTGGIRLNRKLTELFYGEEQVEERSADEVIANIRDGLDRLGKS